MNRYRIQSVSVDAYDQDVVRMSITLTAVGPFDLGEANSQMLDGRLLTLMPGIPPADEQTS